MINIKVEYKEYADLIDEFGIEKIESRFSRLRTQMENFISAMGYTKKVMVNDFVLTEAILDYLSDVLRIKSFHDIKKINEIKIKSYESYWILKRKPIQILENLKEITFINEKFVVSHLASFLSGQNKKSIFDDEKKRLESFANSLFYFFKYRPCDAQNIEMIILSFKSGEVYATFEDA